MKKNKISCYKQSVNYLLTKLAPVLFNHKPGTLIGLNCWYNDSCNFYNQHRDEILERLNLEAKVIKISENITQVYFYRKEHLAEVLGEKKTEQFMSSHGYDISDIDGSLELLSSRFGDEDFPHELGVFVGYPLKDVKGFIKGQVAEDVVSPWKIYHPAQPSINLLNKFKVSVKAMRLMLDRYHHDDCISKLQRVFRRQRALA